VARRLLRGLQVRRPAQKPGPSPGVHQPGNPPESDSDRAPPQVRQIDRPPPEEQRIVPPPAAVQQAVS